MSAFLLLWAIYGMAIFLLSVISSVIRGAWMGVKFRYAMAVGLIAAIFHFLVQIYLKGGIR